MKDILMSERFERYRLVLIGLMAAMMLGMQPAPGFARQTTQPPQPPRMVKKTPAPATQATGSPTGSQTGAPAVKPTAAPVSDIDVQNYRIEAEMTPATNVLKATSTVTFQLLKPARSAVFELNGALRVSAVRGADGKPVQFVQDTLDQYNVKVDLGQTLAAGQQATLTFDYAGQLTTPEGGPLQDRRLAYVGPEGSYLHYAARWFPFHEYGADRATASIRMTIPSDWKLAAHSDTPLAPVAGKTPGTSVYEIAETAPVLPGTLAAGPYIVVPVQSGGFTVEYYAKPGSEATARKFAEETSEIAAYYAKTFGPYSFGNRYVVAQTDDESLDMIAGTGIEFMSNEALRANADLPTSELARELALQWWGQAVGLQSFDSIWLSYGLAQYSALLYEQANEPDSVFAVKLAEVSERALTYESDVSIAAAPSQLNDQTPGFRAIVFYKGAYVFHMLRDVMGDQKFTAFLRDWYAKNRNKNVSIGQFESAASAAAGTDLRWFFGLWVDSTGVPEFSWDYTILKTKAGQYRVKGTLKQSIDGFRMPVDVLVSAQGGDEKLTVNFEGKEADFNVLTKGGEPTLTVDPERKILRESDSIRTAVVVRRGIEEMARDNYIDAEAKFHDALKLAPRSSWAAYNLGLLYMKQRNFQKAVEAFSQTLGGDLDPSWLEVWALIYRGNAYDALGQRDRAVAEYNKAVENGSDYDRAQEAAQRYLGEAYRPAQ